MVNVSSLCQKWHSYYLHNKFLFVLEAIATCSEMMSAITMATFSSNPPMIFIYPFYMLASSLLAFTTYKRGIHWMTFLMCFYLCASLVGYSKLLLNAEAEPIKENQVICTST